MDEEFELMASPSAPAGMTTLIKANLWQLINATLFRAFPTRIKKPRNLLLRLFGARLAKTVTISRTATIDYPWNLEMGSLSSLGAHSCVGCQDKIVIGEKCRIGERVKLFSTVQPTYLDSSLVKSAAIVIDNGCWISAGSSVLRGVTLGSYTMVGEQSVVAHDTAPYSTVAGIPAKKIEKIIVMSR
jgi:putative colanic acid biosynthesis acetyltransferase WcaF